MENGAFQLTDLSVALLKKKKKSSLIIMASDTLEENLT